MNDHRLTLYSELRDILGRPPEWVPPWATVINATRTEDGLQYVTHPDHLNRVDVSELHALAQSDWDVQIDSPRLNRLRITMTRERQINGAMADA